MKYIIFLGLGAFLAAFLIIFTMIKNRKTIYGTDMIEKKVELDPKIERILKSRNYKIKGRKRPIYNLIFNNRLADVRLEKTILLKKGFNKYILLINEDEDKFTENKELRKRVLEYNYGSNLSGSIIVNLHDKSIDTISFYNKREKELGRWIYSLLIIVTILLVTNIFFLLNFLYNN